MPEQHPIPTDPRFQNLAGQRFGRLTAVEYAGKEPGKRCAQSLWRCRCDCGREVVVRGPKLKAGHTQSCGCLRDDKTTERNRSHGRSGTPEYFVWQGMKDRCTNPNNTHWKDYGGRGIQACGRWLNSFADFYADMGPRPSPEHTLDRYPNNDGGYEPGNCRWATPAEQGRNKRDNHLVTIGGVTKCLIEWAEETGISDRLISGRLARGWSPEKAISPGYAKSGGGRKPGWGHKLDNDKALRIRECCRTMSDREVAPIFGVCEETVRLIRLRRLWAHVV